MIHLGEDVIVENRNSRGGYINNPITIDIRVVQYRLPVNTRSQSMAALNVIKHLLDLFFLYGI